MEGGGFYNENSTVQAAILTSAVPLLEEAAASVPIDERDPVLIVDYGASEGRNSFAPMSAAIRQLRMRTCSSHAIEIVHTDLPTNDFSTLFDAVENDPASYLTGSAAIFVSAVGRSFYGPVLAPNRVHLGWSSNAVHWMSSHPVLVPDHMAAVFSDVAGAKDAVIRKQDEDWRAFLTSRAVELKPGGRLICQFMGRGPHRHGFEYIADHYWSSIVETVTLDSEERLRLTTPSAGRSVAQVKSPFISGVFNGLSLTHISSCPSPDPFWEQFSRDGDAMRFAGSWANMMRAVHAPSITAALKSGRPAEKMLERIFARLTERLAVAPARADAHQLTVVIEKAS
jgi:cyclopropane-fatty-acyl-phospholipid synthase